MRKRGQARPAADADDMWFTAPGKKEEPEAAVTSHAEPTYEDTWYQILRGREESAAEPVPDEAPAGEPEPAGT